MNYKFKVYVCNFKLYNKYLLYHMKKYAVLLGKKIFEPFLFVF